MQSESTFIHNTLFTYCIVTCNFHFSADQFCFTTNDGMLKISLGSMNNPYEVEKQVILSQCMINFPRMEVGNVFYSQQK